MCAALSVLKDRHINVYTFIYYFIIVNRDTVRNISNLYDYTATLCISIELGLDGKERAGCFDQFVFIGILGQVLYLIVSIPDLYTITYFHGVS